jgi:hypothetical protein
MSPDIRPIIVGGCHRSGTSLLRRILNAHSHIYCGPEVKFFRDFYGDYLRDPLQHGRFFRSARAILPEAELLEIAGQAFIALHQRAAARAGKRRWADKNPENVLYLDQWQCLLGENWLFIHVVRNPLDTLASLKEANFRLIIEDNLEARIALYQRYTRAGLDFGNARAERTCRVCYEDLVRFPRPTLEGLMNWIGEVFEPAQLDFNQTVHERGLEDPKIAGTKRIHEASLGRWRHLLSRDEADAIWRETQTIWASIAPRDTDNLVLDVENRPQTN